MRLFTFAVCTIGIIFFTSISLDNYNWILSNILSMSVVFGGTFIATLISFPIEKIKKIKTVIRKVYSSTAFDYVSQTGFILHTTRDYKKKGFKTLEAAQVKVAGDVSGTVREAVAAFVDGQVKLVSEPNAQGHW